MSDKTQQSFDAAMMEGEVSLRNGSALLIGSGGSGKSHFLAALLEEKSPSLRESTPCANKPVRAVSCSKLGVDDSHFIRITESDYSKMLVSTAECLPEVSKSLTTTSTTESVSEADVNVNIPANCSLPVEKESSKFGLPVVKFGQPNEKTWCVRRAMKRQHLQQMQVGLKKRKLDLNCKDTCFMDLRDSGGQSAFHEILPVFSKNTMVGIIVEKINERLDSRPRIEFYRKGVRVGEPFDSPFTRAETIQQCVRTVNSTSKRETPTMIALAFTHKDLEHECTTEDRKTKEEKLRKIVSPNMEDYIITNEGSLIHAVNVKSPGKEDKEVISKLRKKILTELRKIKPERFPLRYIPLELAFHRLAKEQQKSVMSKDDCYQVAVDYNFTRESFEAALKHLHRLKLIFYYDDILPEVVIIDAQALLDKITELVVYSFELHAKTTAKLIGAIKKFAMHGIVTMEILSKFDSYYVPNLFEEKELILLFSHLGIMAKVGEGEYLMPCVLKKEDVPCPMPSVSSEGVPALLIYFGPDGAMLGVYIFLLASLITDTGWKLLERNHYPVQLSRNRARFVLPGNNPGYVTITDSISSYFHIAINPPEGDSAEEVRQICEEVCPSIRETILAGIRKASQRLNYDTPDTKFAFPCSTCQYPATFSYSGLRLTCTDDPSHCCKIPEGHCLWFGSKGTRSINFFLFVFIIFIYSLNMLLLYVDSSSQAGTTAAPEKPPHCATGKSFLSFCYSTCSW